MSDNVHRCECGRPTRRVSTKGGETWLTAHLPDVERTIRSRMRGRTYSAESEPRWDEVLIAEIDRLRLLLTPPSTPTTPESTPPQTPDRDPD